MHDARVQGLAREMALRPGARGLPPKFKALARKPLVSDSDPVIDGPSAAAADVLRLTASEQARADAVLRQRATANAQARMGELQRNIDELNALGSVPSAETGGGLRLSSRVGLQLQTTAQGLVPSDNVLDNFARGLSGDYMSVLEGGGERPLSYSVGSTVRSGLGLVLDAEDFHAAGQAFEQGNYLTASMYAARGVGAVGLTAMTLGDYAWAKAGATSAAEGTGLRFSTYTGDVLAPEFIGPVHPLQGMSPVDAIRRAESLGLQTERDELILWAGLGRGREGIVRSQAYAAENGGRTLEMTPGGKWLDQMQLYGKNSPYSELEADYVFSQASQSLVRQASGQVRAVLGRVDVEKSVFRRFELPAVQTNPSITGLDTIYLKPRYTFGGN